MKQVEPTFPPFALACPRCRAPLRTVSPDVLGCAAGHQYRREAGIWRLLPSEREAYFRRFMEEYETVRRDEGRHLDDPAYHRALPYEDRSGRYRAEWRVRAASFDTLLERVVAPRERATGHPLAILDVGAGNGWLAYRLAARGHHVVALDLQTNPFDGLGACRHYGVPLTPVQAEFDRLPVGDGAVDLVVFNGALHYSTDCERTLREAWRVLRDGGTVAVMDSPVYGDERSGQGMVWEREHRFLQRYGFASDAIPCENYLTETRLAELADALKIQWEVHRPWYGWRWALRPWRARLRGRRQPARFMVLAARKEGDGQDER